MEIERAPLQLALRFCRSISLAQIVVPRWAMVPLGPEFGVGDVARNGPSVGAIALAAELHALHDGVEQPRLGRINPILDFDDNWPTARAERETHLRVGDD